MSRTTIAAVPLLLSALLLAGCGGDEEPDADPTTASPTMSESPDTPTSDAPSGDASEDSVEPASGETVESKQFSYRLPKGWEQQEEVMGSTFAYDPDNTDAIELTVVDTPQSSTLDEAARTSLKVQVRDGLERVEDTELGGVPAFHIVGPERNERAYEQFGLWLGGQFIAIGFEIRGDEAFRQELIASVLATWTWT